MEESTMQFPSFGNIPHGVRQGLLTNAAGAVLLASALAASQPAQARFFLSVNVAPPPIPVYVQPATPAPGFIWVPGYWAYGDYGYYWVPGTWVRAPYAGALWTPGYWGWSERVYVFHPGYWGLHVGYYGGIDYGFGYTGVGYYGGYWNRGAFFYNSAVNRVGVNIVNVYNRTVIDRVTVNRFSFNGPGGIQRAPTAAELAFAHERHFAAVPAQVRQRELAARDPAMRAALNHGTPALAATGRAGVFDRSERRAETAAMATRNAQAGTASATKNVPPGRSISATSHQIAAERAADRASATPLTKRQSAMERQRFKEQRATARASAKQVHRERVASHARSVHMRHHAVEHRFAAANRGYPGHSLGPAHAMPPHTMRNIQARGPSFHGGDRGPHGGGRPHDHGRDR